MYLVGLTGGIASGKSSVSQMLQQLGCTIIDADLIARQVVEVGSEGWLKIRETFGLDICLGDGSIDRAKLGQLVFGDASKRRQLNSITHPLIRRRMAWLVLKSFIQGERYVVLDTPLLLESGAAFSWLVSEVVVIYCDRETQLARLMSRNQLDEDEAQRRIDSQLSLEEKKSMVTHPLCLINNGGDLTQTRQQVIKLKRYLDGSWRPEVVRSILAAGFLSLCLLLFG